jgi:argininosuccinate synthase
LLKKEIAVPRWQAMINIKAISYNQYFLHTSISPYLIIDQPVSLYKEDNPKFWKYSYVIMLQSVI